MRNLPCVRSARNLTRGLSTTEGCPNRSPISQQLIDSKKRLATFSTRSSPYILCQQNQKSKTASVGGLFYIRPCLRYCPLASLRHPDRLRACLFIGGKPDMTPTAQLGRERPDSDIRGNDLASETRDVSRSSVSRKSLYFKNYKTDGTFRPGANMHWPG
jgi:hypothetical protein